jgi:hypothetical protein
MTLALLVLVAVAYLLAMLALARFLGEVLRSATCACRKGGWHPDCPIHGKERIEW